MDVSRNVALHSERQPHLPIPDDLLIQVGRTGERALGDRPSVQFAQVLPFILNGDSSRQIAEKIPGITHQSIERARRVFRAKFNKAASYADMPPIVALFDENTSYRFMEVARPYTGLSTHVMAEKGLSVPDRDLFAQASGSGVDVIFTRDLRLSGGHDLSWLPDGALRTAIGGFTSRAQTLAHFPLIVQIDENIVSADDFTRCLERDIMSIYCARFGLIAPIMRVSKDGLRFVKTFMDYALPHPVVPRKALTDQRRVKGWLKMAYRQANMPALSHAQKRNIKRMATQIAATPAAEWRVQLTESQKSALSLA